MIAYQAIRKIASSPPTPEPLTRQELPYVLAMIALDIAAPILMMIGIKFSTAANVSLLNNFEIVATTLIATAFFHEAISRHLSVAVVLVTAASLILGLDGADSFTLQWGSIFVIAACICWGIENNCTRMISSKDAVQIVAIKGMFSGLGSLIIAHMIGEAFPSWALFGMILLLGAVAYGLSIVLYILAQRDIGAAKTSAYYSVTPFIGVLFSVIFVGERPGTQFYMAAIIMVIATIIMARDSIRVQHTHEHSHTYAHIHQHGPLTHAHEHTHVHSHLHSHNVDTQQHDHDHNKSTFPHDDYHHADPQNRKK
ncbi:DMT family transporter [Corynebacterium ulcerans]|uniref:DMT family transporter n=1 Tax=Corynebacterium ulcerans TaxID=65058 RepID=UPI0005FEA8FF|nr:DMT family transporter [Corynebacterium ulcerans]AKA96814.1 Membrane protein [Corynebacterium ulcerans]